MIYIIGFYYLNKDFSVTTQIIELKFSVCVLKDRHHRKREVFSKTDISERVFL